MQCNSVMIERHINELNVPQKTVLSYLILTFNIIFFSITKPLWIIK